MIDLHIHSTKSDGTLTPTELVQHAVEQNIKVMSLTDHDTLAGIDEARQEAHRLGVHFIPGIEISAKHPNGSLHILGYGVHDNYCPLLKTLKKFRTLRNRRNRKMIEKLQELGYDITFEDLHIGKDNSCIGKPHIAQALIRKNIVSSFDEAFKRFLGITGEAYIEKEKFDFKDAIRLIHDAGGVAVLAHPKTLNLSNEDLINFIKELKILGLDGIEVYYPKHTEADIQLYLEISQKFDLMVSAGSDYHGANKPDIEMGHCHLGELVSENCISTGLINKHV